MGKNGQVIDLQTLRIQLLGEFRVWVGEIQIQPEQWKLRKAQKLLKLLALAPHHRLHKEEIIEQLWPESESELAANSLHRTLYITRRTLAPPGKPAQEDLIFEGERLCLRPELPLWVDVAAFEAAAAQAYSSQDVEAYQAALALYNGELLPEDRYEEWASRRREALSLEYLGLLLELARLHEMHSEYDPAIEANQRLLSMDPAHEEAHASLMRLYALSGQRQLALRQYLALQQTLRRELDVEPGPPITRLYQEILSGRFPPPDTIVELRPVSVPGLVVAGKPDQSRNNLPLQLTSFVGRERELTELHQLLSPTPVGREGWKRTTSEARSRLLTLTGAGGSGKTRLAQEYAIELVEAFPDGVWLVELARLSDPELIPRAVASTLGVRELSSKPLFESLVAYLKSRQLLLLLDNCEHLIEACARLAEGLLRFCPLLHILATSREALDLPGECLYPLSPLSVPDLRRPCTLEELEGYEAVRLFVERAQMVRPDFALSEHNAPFVTQVCVRLDGLPLALELAAAWVNLLSIKQIDAHLDDRFRLLARGSRTAPDRQQTLQAALDWSYHLLSEPEQTLFRRLSVFAGGFDLEAVEAVGSDSPEGLPAAGSTVVEGLEPSAVLNLLSHLADKSIIVVDKMEGSRRYHLLETMRAYAREHLEASGEAQAIRRRHAVYFQALAEQAEPELKSSRQLVWLERLEREHDNLRVALSWCMVSEEIEIGQRIAGALSFFWPIRGHTEGLRWLEETLARRGGTKTSRMKAIAGAVSPVMGYLQKKPFENAAILCQEGLELAQSLGDKAFTAFFLIRRAHIQSNIDVADSRIAGWVADGLAAAQATRDRWLIAFAYASETPFIGPDAIQAMLKTNRQVSAMAEEVLSLARETGDRWLTAYLLFVFSFWVFSRMGDFPRARAYLEECKPLFQELGYPMGSALVSVGLGGIAFFQGDYSSAYHHLEKRLNVEVELDHTNGIIHSLNALGMVAHAMGDDGKAQELFEKSLALCRESDYSWGGAVQLNSLGFLKLRQGDMEKAQADFLESLKLYRERNDRYLLAGNLYALSKIAALQGQLGRAARWMGAVGLTFNYTQKCYGSGIDIWITEDEYARDLDALRSRLDETAFSTAWVAGRLLGLEGAIQEALALDTEIQVKKPQK